MTRLAADNCSSSSSVPCSSSTHAIITAVVCKNYDKYRQNTEYYRKHTISKRGGKWLYEWIWSTSTRLKPRPSPSKQHLNPSHPPQSCHPNHLFVNISCHPPSMLYTTWYGGNSTWFGVRRRSSWLVAEGPWCFAHLFLLPKVKRWINPIDNI